MEYTYFIDFEGKTATLTPNIDWSWWKAALTTLDPLGSNPIKKTGLDPVKCSLSSNVLVQVKIDLWTPTCGIELENINGKIKYRLLHETGDVIALGKKPPTPTETQIGGYLVELSPNSHFALVREDKITDELIRYHLKWDLLFNRCRLIHNVEEPKSLILIP